MFYGLILITIWSQRIYITERLRLAVGVMAELGFSAALRFLICARRSGHCFY